MFVRNGQALGSVNVAELKASAETKPKVETKPVPEPVLVEIPKPYASKAEWVDFAVAKGADRAEADELTKPELIDLYGDGS